MQQRDDLVKEIYSIVVKYNARMEVLAHKYGLDDSLKIKVNLDNMSVPELEKELSQIRYKTERL